jgi:VanZ family protein
MPRSKVALVAVFLVGVYWLLMFAGTHLPERLDPVAAPAKGRNDDKLVHCVAYAGLAFLLCSAGSVSWGFRRSLLALVLLVTMTYASFDEWTQHFVGRDTEWFESNDGQRIGDLGADVLGIGVGLSAFMLFGEPLIAYVRRRGSESRAAESAGSSPA